MTKTKTKKTSSRISHMHARTACIPAYLRVPPASRMHARTARMQPPARSHAVCMPHAVMNTACRMHAARILHAACTPNSAHRMPHAACTPHACTLHTRRTRARRMHAACGSPHVYRTPHATPASTPQGSKRTGLGWASRRACRFSSLYTCARGSSVRTLTRSVGPLKISISALKISVSTLKSRSHAYAQRRSTYE